MYIYIYILGVYIYIYIHMCVCICVCMGGGRYKPAIPKAPRLLGFRFEGLFLVQGCRSAMLQYAYL